jgi:hypothetical protein
MELNVITLLYLFFRLAPFIIVCYFSLSSIFNQDAKGLIYLIGLLLACFSTYLIGSMIPISFTNIVDASGQIGQVNGVCNLITIGKNGSFSNVPIGIAILTYTLVYLVYIIAINHLETSNIPTLIFFPVLILADIIWNIMNNCFKPFGIVVSIVVGGGIGAAWAYLIDSFKQPRLFFLNVGSDKVVCQRPSKQLFKCTFSKPPDSTE